MPPWVGYGAQYTSLGGYMARYTSLGGYIARYTLPGIHPSYTTLGIPHISHHPVLATGATQCSDVAQ